MKKILLFLSVWCISTHLNAMDGTLDTTFGSPNGFVIDLDTFFASSVAIQTDGKIVICNQSTISGNIQLVRYLTDGSLDASFGIGGKFEIPGVFLTTLLIQPDGKIVAGGQDFTGNSVLVRATSTGSLDTTFGTGGFAVGSANSLFYAITLQTDSKIIATGSDFNLGVFGTTRFNADGTVDIIFEAVAGEAYDLALQADGKIMAGGLENSGGIVVRYNTDGTLDASYGAGGIATGIGLFFSGIVMQKDGKTVAAGFDSPPSTFELLRFTTSGILDPSFGMLASGVFVGPPGLENDVVLQADQKSVVLGVGDLPGFPNLFQLVRYDINGTALDPSFGVGGIAINPEVTDFPTTGALQQDGKIIAVGRYNSFNSIVVRYLNSPALTSTQILVPINGAVLPPGTVMFSGTAQNPANVYILVNGVLLDGVTTDPLGTDTWTFATSIVTPGPYTIQAVAIYENGNVNLASDAITITIQSLTPPINPMGTLACNKFLNTKECVLTITWQASTAPDVVAYRIFRDGVQIAEVPSTSLSFVLCAGTRFCTDCCSLVDFNNLTIASVNSDGDVSDVAFISTPCSPQPVAPG